MKRLVAVDTSTWWGGVALLERESDDDTPRLAAEAGLLVSDSHSAHLLSLLEWLLAELEWPRNGIDGYAATRGPGSFTGIRVGLGTVRGLSLASGRPAFGIGTLDALAQAHGPDDMDRVPMLDAGRGEVYAARFSPDSSPPVTMVEPVLCAPAGHSPIMQGPVAVFGPGADLHHAVLETAGARVRRSPAGVAAAAGVLAFDMLDSSGGECRKLSPLYIRPPDAVLKNGSGSGPG